uniref:F-box associated beta-propeller type 3 domain-containing protein n=1 Tax=Fagus sylvatica TaxID=28930 RepID=A0A2N9EXS9_FAGSY
MENQKTHKETEKEKENKKTKKKRINPTHLSNHHNGTSRPHPDRDSLKATSGLNLSLQTLAHLTTTLHWVDTHSSILNTTPPPSIRRRQFNLNTKIHLPLPQTSTSCFTEQDFGIVNSCNGLLCLSKSIRNNPHFICNPITGEFITVGHEEKEKSLWGSVFPGFGYCPKSKKYKVVRLVIRLENMFQRMAEVYTLGSTDTSWRSIGSAPFDFDLALFPTYLNGVIHWVKASDDEKKKEKFNEVLPPPHFGEKHKEKENLYNLNMGVLGGCLSLCDYTCVGHLDIWMMKEYADPASWTKEYVISVHFGGIYRPIKLLENGDLLMMYKKRELVAYDPIQGCFRYIHIQGVHSEFEAIIHVPSFIPLKDAVGEDHLNVQNVKARWSCRGFTMVGMVLYVSQCWGNWKPSFGYYSLSSDLWSSVLRSFGVLWVFSDHITDLLSGWYNYFGKQQLYGLEFGAFMLNVDCLARGK